MITPDLIAIFNGYRFLSRENAIEPTVWSTSRARP